MKKDFLFAALVLSCFSFSFAQKREIRSNLEINSKIKDSKTAQALITPYKKELDEKMSEVLSYTTENISKDGLNSTLGNLLADFTYDGTNAKIVNTIGRYADAAIINLSGQKTQIEKGNITLKDVYEIMPYENEIVVIQLKGSDVQKLFDIYAEKKLQNPVSGMTMDIKSGKAENIMLRNFKIQPNNYYYIATVDYLAMGGDGLVFFKNGVQIQTGLKLRDVLIEYFKKNNPVKITKENRINLIN